MSESAYVRIKSEIKYYSDDCLYSSRGALSAVLEQAEADMGIQMCQDYYQDTWYINKEDVKKVVEFLQSETDKTKYNKVLSQYGESLDDIVHDLQIALKGAELNDNEDSKEFVIVDWLL